MNDNVHPAQGAGDRRTLETATLGILAGGQGSRMGRPKGELLLHGRPILSYLLKQLNWHGPTMLVTAPGREHPPGWEQFSIEVTDAEPLGPLGGILTALQNAQTAIVAVLTVDMPAIERSHVNWLLQHLKADSQVLGVMPTRMTTQGAQPEPFPSVYRQEAMAVISARLQRDRKSVHSLLEEERFRAAPVPEVWPDKMWANLNSAADLADFLSK